MLFADTTTDQALEIGTAVADAMATLREGPRSTDDSTDLSASLQELLQLIGDPGAPLDEDTDPRAALALTEQRLVRWLTPHLRLIQKHGSAAVRAPGSQPTASRFLDQGPLAIALCDITGYVRWANRPMDALLLALPKTSLRDLVELQTNRPVCHSFRIGERTHELVALNIPALGPTNVALLAKPGNVKPMHPAAPRPRLVDQSVLIDGRRVGFNEYGPADGQPVLLMHNWWGSRLQVPLDNDCLHAQGIRLIVPDQPGYGLTPALPPFAGQDTLTLWPRMVEQLADALDLPQFAIMGHCTGAIHALACARAMPRRITRVTLVSPFAPIRNLADMASLQASGRLMHNQVGKLPEAKLPLMQLWSGQTRQQPGQCRDHFLVDLALRDHAITASAAQQALHTRSFVEAIHQSDEAPLLGLRLIAHDWSRLLDVRQPVLIWHGDEDRTVPPSHGQRLVHTLHNAKLRHVPGYGHDLYYQHWPEIIRVLGESLASRKMTGLD
ncbi:MAG: alpha/beta fold hydrolase [Acidobacteriota bacterium]